jgi:hypothetical protein
MRSVADGEKEAVAVIGENDLKYTGLSVAHLKFDSFNMKPLRAILYSTFIYQFCATGMKQNVSLCTLTLHFNKGTPWPESASELYRPSDHRLPAKLVSNFASE